MLNLFCRKLLFQANTCRIATTHLFLVQINGNQDTLFNFIQNPNFKSISSSTTNDESSSFTVSYLIQSCGLSPESAVKVAKKVNLKTPTDTPDSVLEFFVNHGFTKPQITHLIKTHPSILLYSIKVLDPKLQFLKKIGFSETDIPKVITAHTSNFIRTSLQDRIIPSYNFLRILYPNDLILSYFQRFLSVDILEVDLEKHLPPKLKILKDHQVPDFVISTLIFFGRRVVSIDIDIFNEVVNEVIELGVNPSRKMFAHAVRAYLVMSKAKRVAKVEIYKSFGWSDNEIRLAIKKQPICISISEDKLRVGLDFFMNKMNWEPQRLAEAPNMLGLNLEKRVFPRLKVIEFLISNGLLPSSTYIARLLFLTDADFITLFLTKSKNRGPEVMKLYQASKQRFPWASSELKQE